MLSIAEAPAKKIIAEGSVGEATKRKLVFAEGPPVPGLRDEIPKALPAVCLKQCRRRVRECRENPKP